MLTLFRLFPILLIFAALPAFAQDKPTLQQEVEKAEKQSPEKKNYVSLSVENDKLNGSDRYYTAGTQLSWFNAGTKVPDVIDDIAETIPMFEINESTGTMFTLGQTMYSPEDISARVADPDDRPWAAWLYGSVGLATLTDNHVDEVEITLGVVGPEALGEQTQKFIHKHISNSPAPKGWSNQLEFEPGLILSWQRRWPQDLAFKLDDYYLRATPNVNVSVGNIYTYAGTGLSVTFGPYQDRLQDTPARPRPSMPGTGYFKTPDNEWSWFLFASVDGRAMARNIFLDGNSFDDDGPSVDKKPLVGDASIGAAITFDDYRLSYALNGRSKEFDGQNHESLFSTLTLSTRF